MEDRRRWQALGEDAEKVEEGISSSAPTVVFGFRSYSNIGSIPQRIWEGVVAMKGRGTLTFVASACIMLALSGCGVINTMSNTSGTKPGNQLKTTHPNGTPIHQTKYKPIQIPKLPTSAYKTTIPVVLLPEHVTSNKPVNPHPPKTVAVDLPPALKGGFVAYFAYEAGTTNPLYIVLPKSMKPFGQNLVGQDGSFVFTFKDSSGNRFEVGTSAMCNGCAASAGAGYFAAAEKGNLETGGNKQPSMKKQGANVTYPESDLALYAYSDSGIKNFGFNQYTTNMNKIVWGLDFQANYKGTNPDMNRIPWILENLIKQNEVITAK